MGIKSLSLTLSIFIWGIQAPVALSSPFASASKPEPWSKESIERVLSEGSFSELRLACIDAVKFSLNSRLKALRKRLLATTDQAQSLKLVLENAEALMACKAPIAVNKVLSRFAPADGSERREWLLMSWRASSASMDHHRASIALRRLVKGDIKALDREELTVGYEVNGQPVNVFALDALAEHERSLGRIDSAVSVLLSGEKVGLVKAQRLALAAELAAGLSGKKYEDFLDIAFHHAEKENAWGLALEILKLRLKLDLKNGVNSAKTEIRLQKLSRRLDDRYTLLRLVGDDQLELKPPQQDEP